MAHLIDKDALVAEIDERIKAWNEHYDDMRNAECYALASGTYLRIDELKDFKRFIDTLDVKEVDLEKSARHYLLHEHLSPLNNILHQADLKTEMQYHKDIESAFKAGYELGFKVNQD